MNKNYLHVLNSEVDGCEGKWIAIVDKEIVSSGVSVKKVYEEAKKKYPKSEPLLNRVDENIVMVV